MQAGGEFKMLPSEQKGISDLIGFFARRFTAIEVKAPGGSLSPEQCEFLDSVAANDAVACVAVSTEIVRVLQEYHRLEMWLAEKNWELLAKQGHVWERPGGLKWLIA